MWETVNEQTDEQRITRKSCEMIGIRNFPKKGLDWQGKTGHEHASTAITWPQAANCDEHDTKRDFSSCVDMQQLLWENEEDDCNYLCDILKHLQCLPESDQDEDQVQEEGSQKDQIHQTKSASFSRITSYLTQTPTITNISLIPDAVNNALRNAEWRPGSIACYIRVSKKLTS